MVCEGLAAAGPDVAGARRVDVEVWPEVLGFEVDVPDSGWRLFLFEPFLDPLVDRTAWTCP